MIQIYKASAGSGKTFNLAREYIKYILGDKEGNGPYRLRPKGSEPMHRATLAITFTNKATEEMKSRIIHELAVLAGLESGWTKKSPYEEELCDTFGCTPDQLAESSRAALNDLLFDFSHFTVSTIDSFFQQVLRSFAHEAEVTTSYNIDIDDREVLRLSVDRLLTDLNHPYSRSARKAGGIGNREYLVAYLTSFLESIIDEGSSFNIFDRNSNLHGNFISFLNDIINDDFRANEELIMGYFGDREKFHQFRTAVYDQWREITDATREISSRALEAIDSAGAGNAVRSNVTKMLKYGVEFGYYPKYADYSGLTKDCVKAMDDPMSMFKADKKLASVVSATPASAVEAVTDALHAIEDASRSLIINKIIRTNLFRLGLLEQVMTYVTIYKRENGSILLSDTSQILRKVIQGSDSPFVYEKMGLRFNHYLIDEFQDTSESQWANLRPLVKESIDRGNDDLVIGDVKQCIYRFRGSAPRLLRNLHTDNPAWESTVRGDNIADNTNYRSSWPVVRFNNTLFTEVAKVSGSQSIRDTYRGVIQQLAPQTADEEGYVSMTFFTGDPSAVSDGKALDNMTDHLRRQLESGYRPGDIAILVRSANDGAKVVDHIERVLADDPSFPRFNIVSDNALLISRAVSVIHIVERLRHLSATDYVPDNRKASKREITAVVNDFGRFLVESGNRADALNLALHRFRLSREGADAPSPGSDSELQRDESQCDLLSLTEAIISRLPAARREADAIFISAFQDLVADFVRSGTGDIRSFLVWWDSEGVGKSVSGAGDPNSLNILTIHKAKGLEFPCVHIPFAAGWVEKDDIEWFDIKGLPLIDPAITPPMMPLKTCKEFAATPFRHRYEELKEADLVDRINMSYVAFTRAVNELIVGVRDNRYGKTMLRLYTDAFDSLARPGELEQTAAEAGIGLSDERCPLASLSLDNVTEWEEDENGKPVEIVTDDRTVSLGAPTRRHERKASAKGAIVPLKGDPIPTYEATNMENPWTYTRPGTGKALDYNIERERGSLLHRILARVDAPEDVDMAVAKESVTPEWQKVTPARREEMAALLRERLADPAVSRWFRGYRRVLKERDVITADGETLRLDRMVWTADGEIHLIDYKSGGQPSRRYRRKMGEYVAFLKSAGITGVRAFLFYLDSGEIVELT